MTSVAFHDRVLIGALTCLLAAACAAPAFAGKSEAECRQFAAESQFQLKDSQTFNCGFPDGWNGNWQQNYDYCRSAAPESTDRIARNRAVMMHMCIHVCRDYANTAVADVKKATDGGCLSLSGPQGYPMVLDFDETRGRWEPDYNTHFRWCMSGVSLETLGAERNKRSRMADKCSKCQRFLAATDEQLARNQTTCKYQSPLWSEEDWEKRRRYCYLSQEGPDGLLARELPLREKALRQCTPEHKAFCNRYANDALAQLELARTGKTKPGVFCGVGGDRWSSNRDIHRQRCEDDPIFAAQEERERIAKLKECGVLGPPVPPMTPLPIGAQCSASVELTNQVCLDSYSEPSDTEVPGALHSGCQVGESTEQAIENAIRAIWAVNGFLFTDDPQNPHECAYEVEEFIGCTCERGLGTRSYPGKRRSSERPEAAPRPDLEVLKQEAPSKSEGPADVMTKPSPDKCFGEMISDAGGRCVCPAGEIWRGRSCEAVEVAAPCPAGTSGKWPNCAAPSSSSDANTCPPGTIGTFPHCATPAGQPERSSSGSDGSQAAPGSSGGAPRARCPPGSAWKRGKCRPIRGYGERPRCPPGTFGSPPACCPAGTSYRGGVCLKAKPREQKVQTCPPGTAGTYPNCFKLQQRQPQSPGKPPPVIIKEAPKGDVQKSQKSGGGIFKPKPRGSMTLPPCKPGEARVGNGPCGPK